MKTLYARFVLFLIRPALARICGNEFASSELTACVRAVVGEQMKPGGLLHNPNHSADEVRDPLIKMVEDWVRAAYWCDAVGQPLPDSRKLISALSTLEGER